MTNLSKIETITVPKLSAAELIARAKEKLGLDHIDPEYEWYDFLRGDAGKTFEVLIWDAGRRVTAGEVRKHFAGLKADGNTAAFVAWVTEKNPNGWPVSIPSDSRLCLLPGSGLLYEPDICRPRLRWLHVSGEWDNDRSFVGFREIK